MNEHGIEEMLAMIEQAAQEKQDELIQFKARLMQGQDSVKSFLERIKTDLEENPWKLVGAVALSSFGIGLVLGARRHAQGEAK